MTVQPTPTMGAQPMPNYAEAAHWAFYTALGFWLVAVVVDWAGDVTEGYFGIALGGAALGASVWYAAQHDWAVRRARQGGTR